MNQIQQVSDVYADACVRNESSQLMFLSIFGRDTAVKELMARMELSGNDNHHLAELTLKGVCDHAGESHTVIVGDSNRLKTHTGRLPKRKLFGNMSHLWIYDPVISEPQKGSGIAWIIENANHNNASSTSIHDRVWSNVCQLAPIPLLEHWKETILNEIASDMVFEMGQSVSPEFSREINPRFSKPLGGMRAVKVALTEDFPERVSDLIKAGKLTLKSVVGQSLEGVAA